MYGYDYKDHSQDLNGHKIVGLEVLDDRRVNLKLDDGKIAEFILYGDCCSQSYFTDLKQFEELRYGPFHRGTRGPVQPRAGGYRR